MSVQEQLLSYLSGELDPEAERELETGLFAGAFDGADLSGLGALAVAVREIAYTGALSVVVGPETIARLREAGYRLQFVTFQAGQLTEARIEADVDLVVVTFLIDLRGVTQLDVETCDLQGRPYKRMIEIPFPVGAQSLTGYCDRELVLTTAQHLPDGMMTRFISVTPEGDRVLGEYHAKSFT